MWYVADVEKLALSSNAQYEEPAPSISKSNPTKCQINLKLVDSETNKSVTLSNYPDTKKFFELLALYKPYGSFPEEEYFDEIHFLPIDPLSIKFLDYVDRVDVVTIDSESSAFNFMTRVSNALLGICESIDKEHSLFKITYHKVYKTLLQTLCMKPFQSFGDVSYIYNMEVEANVFAAFKVVFNDVEAAKRLIAKASVKWSEPWSKYAMWR